MQTHSRRGFTLIELLVVIAIIGVLAGIILAVLGTAKAKGVDAAIKSDMHSINTQMELFASTATSYNGGCLASATSTPQGAYTDLAGAALQASSEVNGGVTILVDSAGAYNKVTCNDSASVWAVESPLSASASGHPVMWCMDSTGNAKQETSNFATPTTYQCS